MNKKYMTDDEFVENMTIDELIENINSDQVETELKKNLGMKAVKKALESVMYIKDKSLITQEMADYVINSEKSYLIKYIPDNLITEEMVKKAIRDFGFNMLEIPEKFQTQEMANAVFEKSINITDIPENFQTQEMANKYFNNTLNHIEFIQPKFLTQEMDNKINEVPSEEKEDWMKIQHIEYLRKFSIKKAVYEHKTGELSKIDNSMNNHNKPENDIKHNNDNNYDLDMGN